MASFSKSSTSYDITSSSESENEIRSTFQFNSLKINPNKTFKTSISSNLSSQIANNSLRYFKNIKKNKSKVNESSTQLQNKYSTPMHSLRSLKTKNHLTVSKNKKTKKFKNKNTSYSNLIGLNQKFANAFESSSDSDFPDVKYLKIISKNNEINSSTDSKESRQSISSLSSTNNNKFTINNPTNNSKKVKYLESSTSSNSFESSQLDMDVIHFSNEDGYNNELNLDELLSDCSLSDVLLIRDDRGGSKFSPALEKNNLCLRMNLKSPETLPLNISFEIDNILPSPPNLSNVTINMPGLTSDDNENEPNRFPEDIEMDEQENVPNNKHLKAKERKSTVNNPVTVNTDSEEYSKQFVDGTEIDEKVLTLHNECSKINETESSLEGTKLNKLSSIPNCLKSAEINNSLERSDDHCNHSTRLKNDNKNTSQNISGADNQNRKKSKSREKIMESTSDFLRIKRSSITNKTKKHRTLNTTNKTEDIGLEYDTEKDNFMVEFPNGAIVPAFLSTLKSRKVRKLCACGITSLEIPPIWSQSFHDVLHLNLYKLRFTGDITDKEAINFKENGLCYKIVTLRANQYTDERIKTSIKNVDDFVSLEYGISKTGIQSNKHFNYLAVLPNFKVIGLLQAEHIQEAYTLIADEQLLEKTVPVKFGVSKIWVFIKYKNKNIDFNLMETFREKEKLDKIDDLAFFPDGCQGIQFIQEYTGNKNILIYTYNSNSV